MAASRPSAAAIIALAAACGARFTTFTSLMLKPFFFSIQTKPK